MSFKEVFNITNAGLLNSIALVIFLIVFAAVSIRVMLRSKQEMQEASQLPLEEANQLNAMQQEQIQ